MASVVVSFISILFFQLLLNHQSYAEQNPGTFYDSRHSYKSYRQLLESNCMPCHYRGITNGTDLSKSLSELSESDIEIVILETLKNGDMPPDKVLREILYQKAIEIED